MKHPRKLVLIMAVMLSLMLAVGGTMAYLQDTDEDVNVMTLGNVYISQLEYERVDVEKAGTEAVVQPFSYGKPLYPAVYDDDNVWQPGMTENDAIITWDQLGNEGSWNGIWDPAEINNEVDKFVFVKNTGKSPAYVRTWFAFELGDLSMQEWWDMFHMNINDSHWEWPENIDGYIEETIGGVRYAVGYATYTRNNGVLAAGELSRPSLLQYALDGSAGNDTIASLGETYEILVKSQAVQTEGFANAEAALHEAFGDEHPFADDMVEKDKEEQEYLGTHPVEINGVRFETLQEGIDKAAENGGGTVKVHAPLEISGTVNVPADLKVTVSGLNNTISRAEGFTGTILNVANGATLTVDSMVVDGAGATATGNLIATEGNGSIVLNAGTVLKNNIGAHAVNLATRGGGTLTLNGAEIINNSSDSGAIWGGGHIIVNEGSKINNNVSTGSAGAIRMVSSCNLTMNGGEISNNKAAGDGGAIWGYGSSTYNFNGGEMANNEATGTGGAIYSGTYSVFNVSGDFELYNNKAANSGAIRFTDHASLNMTGGKIYGNTQNGESNAFNTWNNNMFITGGEIADNFSYVGGLGLTIGEADIDGVISYNLSTNHYTAYLTATFNGFKFKVNEEDEHLANFNFKPGVGYTYTSGDEKKLVCLNEGYEVYWDSNSGLFKLEAK